MIKENSFWKLRTKHGRDKIFESPEMIREAAHEYFEWCDSNPLKEEKVFGTGLRETVDVMRAYTLQGLCIFLGISKRTWDNYRVRAMFIDVCEEIEMIVYTQKFTGAAANLLNPTIIARDLGLVDKQDHTISRGDQMDLSVLSDAELQLYYDLQKKIEDGQQSTIGVIQAPKLQIHNGPERLESPATGTGAATVDGQSNS